MVSARHTTCPLTRFEFVVNLKTAKAHRSYGAILEGEGIQD
jgi:hypothetical protein